MAKRKRRKRGELPERLAKEASEGLTERSTLLRQILNQQDGERRESLIRTARSGDLDRLTSELQAGMRQDMVILGSPKLSDPKLTAPDDLWHTPDEVLVLRKTKRGWWVIAVPSGIELAGPFKLKRDARQWLIDYTQEVLELE